MTSHPRIYDAPLWKKALNKPGYALTKLRRRLQHGWQDSIRLTLQHPQDQGIVNQTEIRMVGLRRSGNHALIQWIKPQQNGVFQHLNDVPVYENPYRHKYEYFIDHYPHHQGAIRQLHRQARGEFKPTDWLIYNYEDYPLGPIVDPAFERKHDWYLGPSARRLDVLILRDPFNLLASRLKKGFVTVKSTQYTFGDLWLAYAKEFLGETNYLTQPKICISYNRWVQDREYRRQLAAQLGLVFTDAGVHEVSSRAGGSSFDGTDYAGEARQMDVMSRWQHYLHHDLYGQLLHHPDLLRYAEWIFGPIEGIEVLKATWDHSGTDDNAMTTA